VTAGGAAAPPRRPVSPQEARRSLVARLAAIAGRRELLGALTRREVQVRYKQAFLGMAWAVFLPLSLMAVFSVVRRGTADWRDAAPYPVWAYCGLLAWTLHQTALKGCVGTLVTNRNLLQKVYFPRELFPLAKIGAALVDFTVGLSVLAALMAWHGVPFHPAMALLPLVVAVHLLLLCGVGFALAAANLFFRDVQYVFDVLVLVWMFASPVFLDTAGKVHVLGIDVFAVANPMHPILEGYRDVLLRGGFQDPLRFGLGAALAGLCFVVGLAFFAKAEPRFAERA
jgi:lipopolysaccharide transport system permease protein